MMSKSFATTIVAVLAIASNIANAEKPSQVEVVNPVLPVDVSNADPIPVSVIGAAQTPYTFFASCESLNSNGCQVQTDPVPTGKRLVLHFANASIQLYGSTAQVQEYRLFVGGKYVTLPPQLVNKFSGLMNYVVNEPVLVFVEAGQRVTAQASGTEIRLIASTTLTGYLVDAN